MCLSVVGSNRRATLLALGVAVALEACSSPGPHAPDANTGDGPAPFDGGTPDLPPASPDGASFWISTQLVDGG
jgi:hypothetical protein